MSVRNPGEKIEWGADSEPRKNERVPSSAEGIPKDPAVLPYQFDLWIRIKNTDPDTGTQ